MHNITHIGTLFDDFIKCQLKGGLKSLNRLTEKIKG